MDNAHNALRYKFGLVGKNIDYSFSRGYFAQKFKTEALPHSYVNFDLNHIEDIITVFESTENLKGLNVTIPYKETIIPYLDRLSKKAKAIGAVNTIRFTKTGKRIGYNTDCYGFKKALKPHLKSHHKKALILGTGGASKAVAYTLGNLGIAFKYVSRTSKGSNTLSYDSLSNSIVKDHRIIINCTPLGTFPNVEDCPNIPYEGISEHHILFDLIYNPEVTSFMQKGLQNYATVLNGLEMLKGQAEKSWAIWNRP
ncbi:shikimate dehydrogenase [Winogradskyella maritima]|uniref:Shikimate dehydrogenase family protein n=1 Tax=Winogradskyella maritima TaxID=1517766 RepID=A0ABV8AKR4_9FLAO|nr:shikimate dehydrogenase [Winogradskyella maritima]